MSTSGQPVDGPATSFQVDPLVQAAYDRDDNYFDLVLAAGWPFPEDAIDAPYREFRSLVETCFDPEDLQGDQPNVYLYDSSFLHVTIATLYPIERKHQGEDYYARWIQHKCQLVQEASRSIDWPSHPLEFHFDSIQLGAKAGILLWKETTGGLERIRRCLEQTSRLRPEWAIHAVPDIAHSSFLRFANQPQTPGTVIQERIKSNVIPFAKDTFEKARQSGRPVQATCVRMMIENIPYTSAADQGSQLSHEGLFFPLAVKTHDS